MVDKPETQTKPNLLHMNNFSTDLFDPGQCGPGSNGIERVYTLPRSPELKPHHQMQFSVILRTPGFFLQGMNLTPQRRMKLVYTRPTDRARCNLVIPKTYLLGGENHTPQQRMKVYFKPCQQSTTLYFTHI